MTWSTGLSATADGTGVVAHAESVATRLLADWVGLTEAVSAAIHSVARGFFFSLRAPRLRWWGTPEIVVR